MVTKQILAMIPISVDGASELIQNGRIEAELTAVSVNQGLVDTFEIDASRPDGQEEAELAALQIAGVLGLIEYGQRLVLSALVNPAQADFAAQEPNGIGSVKGLQYSQVAAFFIDQSSPNVEGENRFSGLDVDDAWSLAADFMANHDLLWHHPAELASALKQSSRG